MIALQPQPNLTGNQARAMAWLKEKHFTEATIKCVWNNCMDWFGYNYGFYTWCVAKAYDEHYRKVGK